MLSNTELLRVANNKTGPIPLRTTVLPNARVTTKLGIVGLGLILNQKLNDYGEKNRSRKYIAYRVYGGSAGLFSQNDAASGTYFTLADPTLGSTEAEVRQNLALPEEWGNDLSKIATVIVDAKDISSYGITEPQVDSSGETYKGGASEIVVKNAKQKVGVINQRSTNFSGSSCGGTRIGNSGSGSIC